MTLVIQSSFGRKRCSLSVPGWYGRSLPTVLLASFEDLLRVRPTYYLVNRVFNFITLKSVSALNPLISTGPLHRPDLTHREWFKV